jgi:DNA-binding CsgD family transcriptional regulator
LDIKSGQEFEALLWYNGNDMKQSWLLPLARLGASLSLFVILLCMHLIFTLAQFLPSASKEAMNAVYFFFFAGTALGAVLCPLFLPVPSGYAVPGGYTVPGGRQKPLFTSIGFIALLILLEFTLRSLGFQVWLDSAAIRSAMAVPEGILMTMCYGLFYVTWLRKPANLPMARRRANRTGRWCSLVLGAALLGSVLARYYSVPLLEAGIAREDPIRGAEAVFGFTKWCMAAMAMFAAASVFLMRKAECASAGEDAPNTAPADVQASADVQAPAVKTDWPVILRLIGIASMFTILNAVLDMRALPLYTDADKAIYYPNYLIVAAVVPVLGFLAGISINRFIRRFLLPVLLLFILFSCLPLFEDYPRFNMIMSTLISIAHYTAWVVFTTAVVELHSGGFWFYGAATAIFFSVAFAFLAPLVGPFVPHTREYRVLFIIIAVVFSMLMASRWLLFPKLPRRSAASKQQEPFPLSVLESSNLEDIFRERGLSRREIEVANLLVKEGAGKQEIGERLFIAPGTVKIHISKIYQKFDVKTRAEFMALFVKGDAI